MNEDTRAVFAPIASLVRVVSSTQNPLVHATNTPTTTPPISHPNTPNRHDQSQRHRPHSGVSGTQRPHPQNISSSDSATPLLNNNSVGWPNLGHSPSPTPPHTHQAVVSSSSSRVGVVTPGPYRATPFAERPHLTPGGFYPPGWNLAATPDGDTSLFRSFLTGRSSTPQQNHVDDSMNDEFVSECIVPPSNPYALYDSKLPISILSQLGKVKVYGPPENIRFEATSPEETYESFVNRLFEWIHVNSGGGEDGTTNPSLTTLSWKVLFSHVATFAEAKCCYSDAGYWWNKVNMLIPTDPSGWVSHVQLERCCGRQEVCNELLRRAMLLCFEGPVGIKNNEELLITALKMYQENGDIFRLKQLHEFFWGCIHKSPTDDLLCKTLRPFVFLEMRLGTHESVCKLFDMFQQSTKSQYQIYIDEYMYLENSKAPHDLRSKVLLRCLAHTTNKKTYQLWEMILRHESRQVLEKKSTIDVLWKSLKEGAQCVNAENSWRLYCIGAEMAAYCFGDVSFARAFFKQALLLAEKTNNHTSLCTVLIGGSRMELSAMGERSRGIELAKYALTFATTDKCKLQAYLHWSRTLEYVGDAATAGNVLRDACTELKSEWLVYFELFLLSLRRNSSHAIQCLDRAIVAHPRVGRLRAMWVWIHHHQAVDTIVSGSWEDQAIIPLCQSIREVPRSGEVWVEAARICLNPFSNIFSVERAEVFLNIALQLTPSYGDVFIELIRVAVLKHYYNPSGGDFKAQMIDFLSVYCTPSHGHLYEYVKAHPLRSHREVLEDAAVLIEKEMEFVWEIYHRAFVSCSTQQHQTSPCNKALSSIMATAAVQVESVVSHSYLSSHSIPTGTTTTTTTTSSSLHSSPSLEDLEQQYLKGSISKCSFTAALVSYTGIIRGVFPTSCKNGDSLQFVKWKMLFA